MFRGGRRAQEGKDGSSNGVVREVEGVMKR